MPEFSTLAAVDLGFGDFGSGITCTGNVVNGDAGTAEHSATITCTGRLASAERAQARIDHGHSAGYRNG